MREEIVGKTVSGEWRIDRRGTGASDSARWHGECGYPEIRVSVGNTALQSGLGRSDAVHDEGAGLDNNLIQANVGEVLNVMTRVVNVEKTRPCRRDSLRAPRSCWD